MKKKSFICIALSALMLLSTAMFAACGNEEPAEPANPNNPNQPVNPGDQNPGNQNPDDQKPDDQNPDDQKPDDQKPDDQNPPQGDPTAPVYSDYVDLGALYNNQGGLTDEGKGINSTHDPVVVEAKNGKVSEYYAFSTDNDQYGVQIRKSENLYTWERVGVAINGYTTDMRVNNVVNDVEKMYSSGKAELNEVYNVVSSFSDWRSSKQKCWTLWAPDVVPAPTNTGKDVNGEWWLYSCWTAAFGSEQSVIFKLSSKTGITGPYTYDGIIVQDSSADYNINEIDPSIYYSADGTRMFMSYGSFTGGFATIELNPTNGLRKSGNTNEPGTRILYNRNGSLGAEGSVINYHTVNIYTGDIANSDYDESQWTTEGKYYMMGSWGALAYNYNMRVWTSDTPDGEFTSERGTSGLQVSGTWTWRRDDEGKSNGTTDRRDKETNFYIPGHNDMLTTSDGVNVIAYHTRVAEGTKDGNPSFAEGEHFLYTSMYDFNAKGQLVINPNRYAGEKIGKVTAEDLLSTMDGMKEAGLYSAIIMKSSNPTYTTKSTIARPVELKLNANGTLTMGDKTGAWKVYGDHYIWIQIDGLDYYGSVMPAQIREYNNSVGYDYYDGLTISAISDVENGENKILYMNMRFGD